MKVKILRGITKGHLTFVLTTETFGETKNLLKELRACGVEYGRSRNRLIIDFDDSNSFVVSTPQGWGRKRNDGPSVVYGSTDGISYRGSNR